MRNPLDSSLRQLDSCGCGDGVTVETPVLIDNRPGLDAVAFRIGTHAQFKATLLAALTSRDRAALGALRTREGDDPTIALVDAWATVSDILSFYSERIANEAFLRTATEQRSIVELARSIGYELNPGVAASTWLAFTVEDAPGAPGYATIDVGTKVQSIPGPKESPQVFETTQPIEARKEWNALRPVSTTLVTPSIGLDTLYLKGTTTNLSDGDSILVVGDERDQLPASDNWDVRRVRTLTPVPHPDAAQAYTVVRLDRPLGSYTPRVEPARATPRVFALRQRAALFGANAAEWKTLPESVRDKFIKGGAGDQWPSFTIAGVSDPKLKPLEEEPDKRSGLLGEYFVGRHFNDLVMARVDARIDFSWAGGRADDTVSADDFSVRWTGYIRAPITGDYRFRARVDDGVRLLIDNKVVLDDWHDKPVHDVVSDAVTLKGERWYAIQLEFYEHGGSAQVHLFWTPPGMSERLVPSTALTPRRRIHLDAVYPGIVAESWIVLSTPSYEELYRVKSAVEDSPAKFALSGKSTLLVVEGENLWEKFNTQVRETVVLAQSDELQWAGEPIVEPLSGKEIVLDRLINPPPPAGRSLVVQSVVTTEHGEEPVVEVVSVKATESSNGRTTLILDDVLTLPHRPATTTILGNVAPATHGETVTEVLGSGDAQQSHQHFELKQMPLTYVPATSASGVRRHSMSSLMTCAGAKWQVFSDVAAANGSMLCVTPLTARQPCSSVTAYRGPGCRRATRTSGPCTGRALAAAER